MSYELQKLNARHQAMVNYFLAGYGQNEVAAIFDMTPQGVHIIYNSPVFQAALTQRQAALNNACDQNIFSTVDAAKAFCEEKALELAEKQFKIAMFSDKSSDANLAINSILDRAFGTGKDKAASTPAIIINAEQLQLLQVTAAEVAASGRPKEKAVA